jgi:hypothetical protein
LLLDYFEQHFLPGLITLDPAIIEALRHCQCSVEIGDDSLNVQGTLPGFFNAVMRAANEGGVNLPNGLDWNRCYRLFVKELKQLHADGKLRQMGFNEIDLSGHRVHTQRIAMIYS